MALTRTVTLKMFAETAAAQAKLDAIAAEADKLSAKNPTIKPAIEKAAALRQMAVLRAELKAEGDKAGQDLGEGISEGTKKGLGARQGGGGSWIAGAIGLGAPLAGPLAAAGLSVGAFGALAAKSLLPVGKALTGPGGLAAGWVTLDARQRTAAAGVQALASRYDRLSQSMEPRAFQVFNTALSTANGLLGPLGRLAATSGTGIEHFLVQFENDSGLRQFIGYASTVAPQAISLLGSDVTTLVHSVLTLAQAAGGTGLLELRLLTSGLHILDKVISGLPGPLEGAALGIGGVALALSKLGALSGVLRITGLAAMGGEAVAAAKGLEEATVATRGLAGASAALDAVTPAGWALAGAAAIAGLVYWLSKLGTGTETAVSRIEQQNKALGFNTAGYFSAARAVQVLNLQQEHQNAELDKSVQGSRIAAGAQAALKVKTDALTEAQKNLIAEGRNQDTFLGTLEQKYGLTRDAAISLAQHSGVLASQVNKGGQSMRDAVTQAEAYANSNLKARKPVSQLARDISDYSDKTLTATDRTKALSDALSQFFNPAVSADQAVITLRNDQDSLAKALKASGGQTGLLTQKQRDARSAFDTYINDVASAAQAAFTATGRTSSYTKIINDALPFLERAAGHNKTLRQEIQKLIDTERGIRSEQVSIKVLGSGHWVVTGGGAFGNKPMPVAARGLFVSQGTPGVDDQLIRAQRGELVVPVPIVNSGAVDHLKGMIPGFASGGVVGSYSGSSIPGLNKWLLSENKATISAIETSTAAATLAGMKAAAAAAGLGGGTGAAVARYALQFQGAPYVLGGATPRGWDCCIIGSMKVQTCNGPKEIRDIRAGDVVYSWNDGKLAASRVSRRSRPRYQQTYRLRTIHREIVASGNHPFLTLRQGAEQPRPRGPRGGRSPRTWTAEWVNLEDLRRGDIIVTLRSLPDDSPVPSDPLLADKRFLWLLGLAFGDGSLSRARANRVDLCVFGDLREEVQGRLEDFCGKRGSETSKHGVYLFSEKLASGLRRFGMGATSTERVVPRELWALPHGHIQAFLDGYTAADGHRVKRASDPALSYKAANRGLIEDVRNLHMIIGHNVTRVREMRRTRPIVIKGKQVRNARSLWTFEAYETGRKMTTAAADLMSRPGIAAMFPADSHFAPQRVTLIEPLEEEDTYDITVEGTHNFVAEGLVVHNSGFTAWVYEHFGLAPGRQGTRFGTSESQWAWVKRTPKPEVGGLAFFDDGVFANPGHVGVIIGRGQMISAQDPANGTQISGIGGAIGYGIPPGRTIGSFEGVQGGGRGLPGGGSVTANIVIGRQEASGFGWGTGPSWHDLYLLWNKESGWRNTAQNPNSTAYGIAQFLDGTWATVGGHKTSNPGLQILYGLRYIQRKYGNPETAWAHELAFNSYAGGSRGAAPGWAWTGEEGPELVRFRGGEEVLSAARSAAITGISRGYATGTPGVSGGGGTGGGGGPKLTREQQAGLALLGWFSHLRPGTSTATIRSEERKYLHDIAKYFDGSSAKWRDAEVKRQTGHLIRVGDKISALNSRIGAARSYQQSVRQGLAGYADLSQLTLGGSMQGSRTLSGAQSLEQQLHGQLGNLRKFSSVLRKLSGAHVSPALIRQVVALGPGDGTAFGEEILAGGPRLIRSLNATEAQIGATETAISRGAASAVYEGRYQPGKDFLRQLQHDKAGLQKLFREIGAELGREAARWFRVPGHRRRHRGVREHPGASAGTWASPDFGAPAAAGPLVAIDTVNVRHEADIALIGQKVGFAISAAGLG